MKTLYFKELKTFFNSFVGFLSIAVFLVTTGIIVWVFDSSWNILNIGEASLQTFFMSAPLVFLFLIPAITMRIFSEERKNGTIEILLTMPIKDYQIILAKFLAGITLVLFALLPTLIYYYSVIELGEVQGNIDHAGTWGGYIGLFLLGCSFIAIGIFASSLSQNQVVAFILAVVLCFAVFIGFQFLADNFVAPWDLFFIKLSAQEHYKGLQKGVIDSRDIIYYLSIIILFLVLTRTSLQSRYW